MVFNKLDVRYDEVLCKIKDKKIDCRKEILMAVHDVHQELVPEAKKFWTLTKLVSLGIFTVLVIGMV